MNTHSTTYLDWLKRLPIDDATHRQIFCPECGHFGLEYQYFGFPQDKFGWKLVWCNNCMTGIQISRTRIPELANPLIDSTDQEEFLAKHRDLKLIR